MPGTDITIDKGTLMLSPVLGFQRDEQFYPEPEKFIPERFSKENSTHKSFIERPYMPFGYGPRLCLGMRLGQLQVKIGLVSVLKKYSFTAHDSIKDGLEVDPATVILTPKTGIPLYVRSRV